MILVDTDSGMERKGHGGPARRHVARGAWQGRRTRSSDEGALRGLAAGRRLRTVRGVPQRRRSRQAGATRIVEGPGGTRRPRQTAGAAPAVAGGAAARRWRARGLYLQPYPLNGGGAKMQVSYFETGRYYAPSNLPRQWPMPAGAYDREAGLRAFRGMVERSRYVEELGFDWVSVSEHHYSPRILTPSLPIAAAYIAQHVHDIKIALLGPIVPQSNPVLLAEEMAMLDNMAEGRLVVGMLRGTSNEMMTYDLNPAESRERTDESMELILRAWKEPQPFAWQGRHFHYRTVSVWPKPLQQPLPPMYALGTSSEASDFAARNHIGLGVSFGPFDVMGKVTAYYKDQCARWGWQPEPHQIIYRANIVIAETGEKAQQALAQYPREAVFPLKAEVGAALLELDQRNVAGEGRRPANVNRALPINFCGGPDEIVAQLQQAREQIGCGVVDLSFQTPGSEDPDELMEALELFGKKVLPHIRDI